MEKPQPTDKSAALRVCLFCDGASCAIVSRIGQSAAGATAASFGHTPQLGPYELQTGNLGLNLLQVVTSDLLGGIARRAGALGQRQQPADVTQLKAKVAGMAEKL
jgi:hypothetical protein